MALNPIGAYESFLINQNLIKNQKREEVFSTPSLFLVINSTQKT